MTKNFDFVIVGGGSAGCVLAARLSKNPEVSVCLIEAGGRDWHPLYKIPAGFAKMTKGIGSWGWTTVPQKHMQGRILPFTQARVIGGGSTINAQVYTRGNPLDFDEWRQLGCEGWAYDNVLPYFRKSECNDSFDAPYHGQSGPLGVSKPVAALPVCNAFIDAAEAIGIPRNPDLTGGVQDGVGFYQLTQKNARRSSVTSAFLWPAATRPNLTILLNEQVARLQIEEDAVVGVQLKSETLTANKEIILSSGTIGTPKLLMHSGVGPEDHLQSLGIDVKLNVPELGNNLQDHLDLFTISECTGPHSYDAYTSGLNSVLAGARYLLTRSGPAASNLFETGGFWYAEEGARSPDIQFHFGLGTGIEAGVARMKNGGVTLNSTYVRPRSRGTVRLASSDPTDAPLIDPNYWSDPHDRDMALRGLQMAREILAHPKMSKFVEKEVLPGPKIQSEEDLIDYGCKNGKTDHHPVGTCRMGVDDSAVVNTSLEVNGLRNVRIVDASIMPRLVSSNTNATTIMIAEKAADMISAAHSL